MNTKKRMSGFTDLRHMTSVVVLSLSVAGFSTAQAQVPNVTADDVTVMEADGTADVEFTLDPAQETDFSINVYTARGESDNDGDYWSFPEREVVFAAGETTATVSVVILDDDVPESTEGFFVFFEWESDSGPTSDNVVVAIEDDDDGGAIPTISVSDTTVSEADGTANVTLALSEASADTVTVLAFSQETGTAMQGSDYYGFSSSVEFAPGETSKDVIVTILNDDAAESEESFRVRLANAVNGELSSDPETPSVATVTITDDDEEQPLPTLAPEGDVTVSEADGTATVNLVLSEASTETVTVVAFTQEIDSAMQGTDYYGLSQGITFEPGETSKEVVITILDDTDAEDEESFRLRLGSATNAEISTDPEAPTVATVTITDDDAAATPTINVEQGVTVAEADGTATVELTLSEASADTVSVTVFTQETGTANGGEDFFGFSTMVEFAPGETSKDVVISIIDDETAEEEESFWIRLADAVNGQIKSDPEDPSVGTVTINDDDS